VGKTYVPCFGAISLLGNIVDAFTVSAQEEDFILGIWLRLAIQALNLLVELLPLAIFLGLLGLWTIRAANETKV
jgi:hypothetical protein